MHASALKSYLLSIVVSVSLVCSRMFQLIITDISEVQGNNKS